MYSLYPIDIFCVPFLHAYVHNMPFTVELVSNYFFLSGEAFTCETIVVMIDPIPQIFNFEQR